LALAAQPRWGAPETEAHCVRVAAIAGRLGAYLGMSAGDVQLLRLAARLHDIGKGAVPPEILDKPGPLTPAERAVVETHVLAGDRMLQRFRGLGPARRLLLTHHERYAGGGYPRGVIGRYLPLIEQVLPVADSLDAMTTDRPYRARRSLPEALAELRRGAGTQWNPRVVAVAHRLWMPEVYSGSTVSAVRQQYQAATVRNGR
jgi:putative nucleotidyltransferase with HDIG domain